MIFARNLLVVKEIVRIARRWFRNRFSPYLNIGCVLVMP